MIKYEGTRNFHMDGPANFWQQSKEFDTLAQAQAYVEVCESGRVITWAVHRNLPGCLPEWKYSSCALTVWEDGRWREQNIHGW